MRSTGVIRVAFLANHCLICFGIRADSNTIGKWGYLLPSATSWGPRPHGVRDPMGSATPWGPRHHEVRYLMGSEVFDPMGSATP